MDMSKNKPPQNILISGASSGIGAALALAYAKKGVTLGLIGRNQERLNAIAGQCIVQGATALSLQSDIRDYEAITKWAHEFDEAHPVDLIISNAGISAGTGKTQQSEPLSAIQDIFDINVIAAIHFGQCLYEKMAARGYGQIAFTGSIAGFQGWPGAPAYTASKAAIHTYAEALRLLSAPHHIKVNIIAPGFVKTNMTDQNDFPMPFQLSAESAAKRIMGGLTKNKRYIIFPRRMYLISFISRILPEFLLLQIAKRVSGKK